MGKTTYFSKCEQSFPWICPVKNEKYMTYCKICVKSFRIVNRGLSRVKSRAKCHKSASRLNNQRTFQVSQMKFIFKKPSLILSTVDQVNKAEVLQALHIVNKNLSFASTQDDNDRFRSMFPVSGMAKSYRMSDKKAQYLI